MESDTDIIIINQTICFSPDEHLLYPVGRKHAALSLNVPVSRCLALLLSSDGQVVPRQTFYTEVWENQGLYVTDNTFYQNISLLRKTLRAAGIHDNIIQTVPREGIRFTGTAKAAISIPDDDPKFAQDIISPPPSGAHIFLFVMRYWHFIFPTTSRKILSAIAVISFLCGLSFLLYSLPVQHDVFNSFSKIKLADCQIHYYGGLALKDIPAILADGNVECKNNNEIFLTVNDNHTRTAYTVCSSYSKKSQACHSWLYIRKESQ